MEAIKTVLKSIILLFASLKHDATAQPSLENQMYFKKMYNHGKLVENDKGNIFVVYRQEIYQH